jgi:serine/threonine protein kinase
VYVGTLYGLRVRAKRIRMHPMRGLEETEVSTLAVSLPGRLHLRNPQAFFQEAVVWKRLTHPNIVPLLGVTLVPPQLISEWMSGGDLLDYIKKNPDANRLGLAGVPPVAFILYLLSLLVIGRRYGSPLPSLLRCNPWES